MTSGIGSPVTVLRRPWFAAATAVAAVLIVEMALVGGASMLGRLSDKGGGVAAASASTSAVPSTSLWPATPAPSFMQDPLYPGAPVRVMGSNGTGEGGRDCGGAWCQYTSIFVATDPRLSGCLELQSAVGATDWTWEGLWGVAAVFPSGRCGYLPMSDTMSREAMSWEGEWFTGGPRQQRFSDDPDAVYPVDTVWLHGRGQNEGLTAVLQVTSPASFEGWIFETPAAR